MKNIKNEQMDLQIDELLRKHLKNSLAEKAVKCDGFDPDLATAYAERALSSLALKTYENHLALCINCRQMTAEYMLLFASELPAIEEVKAEVVEVETKEILQLTKENNLSWAVIKEWLFGSQVRWAVAALLILFISGAIWVFSGSNNSSNQVAGNESKISVEKNTPVPSNSTNPTKEETAINDPNNVVNPSINPTPDNNMAKGTEQNKEENKNSLIQTPTQNSINSQGNTEVANKENKPNSVKLPLVGKEDGLTDVTANNSKATPSLPIGENLQVPPPPDIAQNTEKNAPKDFTTNSGSSKSPRNTAEFGVGVVETLKDKRSVGGKTFLLKSGAWIDQEYVNNTKAKSLKKIELKKGSDDYKKALTTDPALKSYFDIGASVTVIYKDTIYIISK